LPENWLVILVIVWEELCSWFKGL